MNFESELSKGKFLIPECSVCMKIVWPPTEFCNDCFGSVSLKNGDFEGEIIEFSKQNNDYFCVVGFENTIKIMAKMLEIPKIGQMVKISKCGISKDGYFFYVS